MNSCETYFLSSRPNTTNSDLESTFWSAYSDSVSSSTNRLSGRCVLGKLGEGARSESLTASGQTRRRPADRGTEEMDVLLVAGGDSGSTRSLKSRPELSTTYLEILLLHLKQITAPRTHNRAKTASTAQTQNTCELTGIQGVMLSNSSPPSGERRGLQTELTSTRCLYEKNIHSCH